MKYFILYLIIPIAITKINAQVLSENLHNTYLTANNSTSEKYAKKYVFNNVITTLDELNKEIESINLSNIRNHTFGAKIAKRIYLIEKYYTYTSEPAPGEFEGRKEVSKPTIYNSIYKVEKHYKKQVRKGFFDKETSVSELTNYLNLALIICSENTDEFQAELENAKDIQDILSLYNRIEIK